jgi:CrcB protein
MTPLFVALAVALAGGVGAGVRFVVDGLIAAHSRRSFPLGTLVINIAGSFLLGVITGLALARGLPADARGVLGTGFLGGFTTFSTASVELARLFRAGRPRVALALGLGMLLASVVAAVVGFALVGA